MPKGVYIRTAEHRYSLSEAAIRNWQDPEYRKKMVERPVPTDEQKRQIRDSLQGTIPWHKGLTGVYSDETLQKNREAHLGKTRSDETKQSQSVSRIKYLQANVGPWRDTKPERELESRLQAAGLCYEKQKRVGNMLVDFYLSQQNLVIEVDGCYWHGCPDCFPDGGFGPDKFEARQKSLEVLGYDAIRIWEHELRDTAGGTEIPDFGLGS